mmetsp:Transcript_28688/g.47485  ORF Transcript_28688/g.47485 Transcript_28688/m.47485 type:complete len:221 (-) Transcript_28688:308-970(-)
MLSSLTFFANGPLFESFDGRFAEEATATFDEETTCAGTMGGFFAFEATEFDEDGACDGMIGGLFAAAFIVFDVCFAVDTSFSFGGFFRAGLIVDAFVALSSFFFFVADFLIGVSFFAFVAGFDVDSFFTVRNICVFVVADVSALIGGCFLLDAASIAFFTVLFVFDPGDSFFVFELDVSLLGALDVVQILPTPASFTRSFLDLLERPFVEGDRAMSSCSS